MYSHVITFITLKYAQTLYQKDRKYHLFKIFCFFFIFRIFLNRKFVFLFLKYLCNDTRKSQTEFKTFICMNTTIAVLESLVGRSVTSIINCFYKFLSNYARDS